MDTSKHSDIVKYQIQWFAGHWSPWFTPGVDDVDWNNPNRRVWALFDDHTHRILTCNTSNTGPSKPDFTITGSYILPPKTVSVGDTITVVVTVKNLGAATKETPIVKESGSLSDFTWQTDFVADRPVSADRPLYQNESLNYRAKGSFTKNGGMKEMVIKVDPGNVVDELKQDNNQEILNILVLGPTTKNVDISAMSLNVEPNSPVAGASAVVKFTGKNNGDFLADTKGILNFYKGFGDFVQTQVFLPTVSTGQPLLSGQTFEISFLGYWQTAGTKDLIFKLDNANELAENNEDNNSISKIITVTATSTSTSTPTYPPIIND